MGKQEGRTPRGSRKLKVDRAFDQQLLCDELLEQIKNAKDASGKSLSEPFMRVPSRRTDPEYYNVVTVPIDLTRINQRLRGDEYNNFEDFCRDVEMVLNNAQLYYKPESEEYICATELFRFYQESKNKLLHPVSEAGSEGPSPVPPPEKPIPAGSSGTAGPDEARLEAILASILLLTDRAGRLVAPPFRVLASKEELPLYYETIANPIDLKMIAQKVKQGFYNTWAAFDQDMQLLVNNCKTFNEPDSQICKDAEKLWAHFEEKRVEFSAPNFDVRRSKMNETRKQIDTLLQQASYDGEADLVEDSEEDPLTESDLSPFWRLYWAVRNLEDGVLVEPFLELVNRDFYPDYYDEIKKPMSFFVVNNRIKTGFYSDFQQMVDDMLLVCYNSRCYNLESSDYHIAAVKLEGFISRKAKDIDPQIVVDIAEVPADEDDDSQSMSPMPRQQSKKRPRMSIGESDESEVSNAARPLPKRKRAEFQEFGSGIVSPTRVHPQGRKSIEEHRCIYKNKLLKVWRHIAEYHDKGRYVGGTFMYLPDPKVFADYYKKIKCPIALETIKNKCEQELYLDSEMFRKDFLLLFNNVRLLYPPHDPIIHDIMLLENVLVRSLDNVTQKQVMRIPVRKDRSARINRTRRSMPSSSPARAKSSTSTPAPEKRVRVSKAASVTPQKKVHSDLPKMKAIYDSIVRYQNEDGRVLSEPFIRLPTKEEYPDYYEKIRRPMDLNKVNLKMTTGQYDAVKDMLLDMKLIFDNACAFNDPNSRIYKDSLVLQKEVLSLRNQYVHDEFFVQAEVKLLLTNLLVSITTHTNNDGHCLSELLEDLPKFFKKAGVPEDETPFSLDEIKFNLDRGRYRRLDRFQEDLFYLFVKAREYVPLDSELYNATVDLQKHFIEKREDLCRNVLITPAKFYNLGGLDLDLEQLVKRRRVQEKADKTPDDKDSEEPMDVDLNDSSKSTDEPSLEMNGLVFKPDDYVYVASADDDAPPNAKYIMRIERIMKDEEDPSVKMVRGSWCYKPRETFHLATRQFYQNEVFLTPFKDTVTADRLKGKCCVLYLDDYLRVKPVGFEEDDIYVCESKYLGKKLHFRRLTSWPYPEDLSKLETTERAEKPALAKVKSELATEGSESGSRASSEKPKTEAVAADTIADLISERVKNLPRVLDIHREEVVDPRVQGEEGNKYYEQMLYNSTWYRRGDGVLAFKEGVGHCEIYRIDKMWRDAEGQCFISGPWFARPCEVKHDPSLATFYKRELIGVEQADAVVNMNRVQARCAILTLKQYESSRPTEFPECDVFVVERRVVGEVACEKSECSLLPKGSDTSLPPVTTIPMDLDYAKPTKKLREYKQSLDVPEDEIYNFKMTLEMEKELSPIIASSETTSVVEHEKELENENVIVEHEVATDTAETPPNVSTEAQQSSKWLASQPKLNAKSKSGYILFSAEVRKRIMSENPEAGFGEVSRIVGLEWKKLNDEQKRQYEVRATYIAEERAKNDLLTPQSKQLQPGQIRVHCCKWQACDFMFDLAEGLYEHIKTQHTSQIVDGENQFVCLWTSCVKYRKEGKPFPSLPRLHRHIKEKHIPAAAKAIFPNQRAKHFFVYLPPPEGVPVNPRDPPSGSYTNHPNGIVPANPISCSMATPIEDMPSSATTTTPRATYVSGVINDGTPHRTVKVVNYTQGQPQYVQQLPNGTVPVQYVAVGGGQSVYQAVVVNNTPGQQPVQVYHHAPGTMIQQQYYQQVPQTSGNQTITVNGQHAHISQPYAGHAAPGPVHVQHGQTVHVSHPYQTQQAPQPQPAPAIDPRTIVTRAPEPNFVQIPDSFSATRVLHTATYKKYLERMNSAKDRYLSNWDKTLGPSGSNPITTDKLALVKQAPRRKVTEDEIARSLYLLRDQLLESTCFIKRKPEVQL